MGELPDWYRLIRSARYLGVAPWDLADQPLTWMEWALASEYAEGNAEAQRAKREAKRRA